MIVCAKTSRSSFGIPHWRVKSIRETLKLLRWKKPIVHKQSKLAIETLSIEVSCTNQRNRISANIDRSLFLSSPHFLILGRVMCGWHILPISSFIHKPSTYLNNKACDTSWVTTPCMGMPYHVTSYMFIWAESPEYWILALIIESVWEGSDLHSPWFFWLLLEDYVQWYTWIETSYRTTTVLEPICWQDWVTIHMKVLDHVMPREKRWGALDSCFWLVGPHQQSIPQLLSLASRGYQEHSTCGSELIRFIPTRVCHWYVLLTIRDLEPRPLPTPAGQGVCWHPSVC